MPQLLYKPEKIRDGSELDTALAKCASANHFRRQSAVLAEIETFANPDLPSRTHQAFPFIWILRNLFREEHFNPPA